LQGDLKYRASGSAQVPAFAGYARGVQFSREKIEWLTQKGLGSITQQGK
jgi:hypothetical protein